MRRRAGWILLAWVFVAGCNREASERRAELVRLLPEVRRLADELDGARRAGLVAAAGGSVVPRPDLGPCPVEARFPIGERDPVVVRRVAPLVGSPLVPLYLLGADVVPTDELGSVAGPRRKHVDADLKRAEEALGDDGLLEGKEGAALIDSLRREADRAFWKPDLTLAADVYVAPKRLDGKRFNSGLAAGRAYLWSYAEGAVICAGEGAAESSSEVKVSVLRVNGDDLANLDLGEVERDLQYNALSRALPGLQRADSPLDRP